MKGACKMKRVAVIYWSGTGNTAAMASAVAEGAEKAGNLEVLLLPVGEAKPGMLAKMDAVALGCPSMGAEMLEEFEMEPFVAAIGAEEVKDKPLVLFGSYDWGDGAWMKDWGERMRALGAKVLAEVRARLEPQETDLARCREAGGLLAGN
jgi:flavodoxin short chain